MIYDDIPPLYKKNWKDFFVEDLFEIFLASGDTQSRNCEPGKFPLISAGTNNNGVCDFIKCGDKKSKVYDGKIISVDMFGQSFFHDYKFYSVSHGRINLLKSIKNFSDNCLKFFVVVINKATRGKFSYNQMCSSQRIKNLSIKLPVNETGKPDYIFMENFMLRIEEKILDIYCDFIKQKNLSDEIEIVEPLSEKNFGTFTIGELFYLEQGRGKGNNHLTSVENGISYLGATNRNNGVLDFVEPVENLIQQGNCIAFIRNGEGSMGYAVYKKENFIASADITVGYSENLNEYTGKFLTTVSDMARGKYNFNYKRSDTRLKREKIKLPVDERGEPDWDYMENFMRYQESCLLKKYFEKKFGR